MTIYFNYTFRYYLDEITISKAVTDNMEDRKSWKKVYASDWMTQTLRDYTNDKNFSCVHARNLEVVSKSKTVPLKKTFKAMEDAKENFRARYQK